MANPAEKTLSQALAAFDFGGIIVGAPRFGQGHINDTFCVYAQTEEGDCLRYILQRMSAAAFKHPDQLMKNITGVTEHLRKKIIENGGDPSRETMTVMPTSDGKPYFTDEEGGAWRVYPFVENTKCLQAAETPELFYASAKAFGKFQAQLSDYPASTLFETIEKFHDTENRFANFIKPDILDINMGCPAPKITGNGSGSALMKNPSLAKEIVYSCKNVALQMGGVGVTVKFRKGWDETSINAIELAKALEEGGADALTIHGRTREQMYSGKADLDIIRGVVDAVKIPVIANGDVDSVESYIKMKSYTGCSLVMIGRGAMGNPWIFERINSYNEKGVILPEPTIEERLSVLKEHVKKICTYKSERIGIKEARKHTAWYFRDMRGAASLRNEACQMESYDDLLSLCENALKLQEE